MSPTEKAFWDGFIKTASLPPQKKKNRWAMPLAGLGLGAAGLAAAYGMSQNKPTPAPTPTPTPAPTPINPLVQNYKDKLQGVLDRPDAPAGINKLPQFEPAANVLGTAGFGGFLADTANSTANKIGLGKVTNAIGLGAASKAMNHNFTPNALSKYMTAGSKAAPWIKPAVAPLSAVFAPLNAYEVAKNDDYSDFWLKQVGGSAEANPVANNLLKGGLGLGNAAATFTGAGMLGQVANGLHKSLVLDPSVTYNRDFDTKSDFLRQTLQPIHKALLSSNPEEVAQGKEAAKWFFSNPGNNEWINDVVNPSKFRRSAGYIGSLGTDSSSWQGAQDIDTLVNRLKGLTSPQ